jgi:hypothetical protein
MRRQIKMNTKQYPDSIRSFLENTKKTAKDLGVSIIFGRGEYVRLSGKGKAGGFFDDTNRILSVATNLPLTKWIELMVHETCHMDQWIESSKYWTTDLNDALHTFDRYISGKYEPNIIEATDLIVMMEADCERRACRKISEYELPINVKSYAKRANAYLLSHKAMIHYQSWYKVPPYKHGCIWGKLPSQVSAPYSYRLKNNKVSPEFFRTCF